MTETKGGFSPEELSQLHVLRGVALEAVWGLLEHCPLLILPAGANVLRAGESHEKMYLILAGALSVHLESPDAPPVARLEAGQTVGELSVIDARPASATVKTATPCRLLAVNETTFWRMVGASHEFATNLLLLLAERMRANNSALAEGSRQRREIERDANVDSLTGLHNRKWLNTTLPRVVQRHLRGGQPLSLMLLDIDHFKRFNDTYGHLAGDLVLGMVGRVLSATLRPTDLGARYGGEELVVILPETEIVGATAAAERLRMAIESAALTLEDGRVLPSVTVSVGVAELADEDMAGLFAKADAALYRAKGGGRNRVEASS